MRALRVTRHGSPEEVLRVVEVAVPEPGPRQVRIRVAAGTLNHNDIDRCRGKLVTVPTPPPFTLGMEVCGVVEAVGPGGEAWVGRRGPPEGAAAALLDHEARRTTGRTLVLVGG